MSDNGNNGAGTALAPGTYDVILADPPWAFDVWNRDTGQGRSAESHYATMSLSDICALPVPASDNAVLLLWACWPLLPDALQVIDAWGFEYKSLAWVWVKANPSGMGHHMGMGYWTRANSEPCLLATRGKGIRRAALDVLAVIYSPVREHSRKPDEQYEKIQRLWPNASKLELFARRKVAGWQSWGNEIVSDIAIGAA